MQSFCQDIESSTEKVRRRVGDVLEEFSVVYAKIGTEPVTIQVIYPGSKNDIRFGVRNMCSNIF